MDEEDKTGVLGCTAALLVIGLGIAGIVWFVNREVGPEPEAEPEVTAADAPAAKRSAPITRVSPVREKTVVAEAAPTVPMARKIVVGETSGEPAPAVQAVSAAVENLGPVTDQDPPSGAVEAAAEALEAEQLCYNGRVARRAPSLFEPTGFAITYGADTFQGGDPLPRLEFFFHPPGAPEVATFLSMTGEDMPGFPDNHELPVVYDETAIHAVVARWVAAIATETCPPK